MMTLAWLWLGCAQAWISSVSRVYRAIPHSVQEVVDPDIECVLWTVGNAAGVQEVSSKEYMRHLRFVAWSRRMSLASLVLTLLHDRSCPLPSGFSTHVARSKNHAACIAAIAQHFGISLHSEVVDRELARLTADGQHRVYSLSTEDVRAELHGTLLELLVLRSIGAYLHTHHSEYIEAQLHAWKGRSKQPMYVLHEFRILIDSARTASQAHSVFQRLVDAVKLGDVEMVYRLDHLHSDSHCGRIISTHPEMPPLPKRLLQEAIDAGRLEPGLVITHAEIDALYLYIVQSILQPTMPTAEAITDALAAEYLAGIITKYLLQCHIECNSEARRFGIAL